MDEDDFEKTWSFGFYNQWHGVFFKDSYNWTDFTFIEISLEDDRAMGHLSFRFALLGFILNVAYNHTQTEIQKEVRTNVKKFMADFEKADEDTKGM